MKEKKIPCVEVNLRYDKASGIYFDMEEHSLSDYMRCEYFDSITRWVYSEKETPEKRDTPDPKLLEIGELYPDANPYIIGKDRIPVVYH